MRSLVLLVCLTGCSLYWPGGGDDCQAPRGDDIAPAYELRDPSTGQCQAFGSYGGDCKCGPCPETAGADIPAPPQWPMCFGSCQGLLENACVTTASCHAAYVTVPGNNQGPLFWGCWDTATEFGVPAQMTGACNTLDATGCIFRDDCDSIYTSPDGVQAQSGTFVSCEPEVRGTSCTGVDCGTGSHCEQQCALCNSAMCNCQAFCVPDNACPIDCTAGDNCVETCDASTGMCSWACVPTTQCEALTTEATCKARTDCEPIYKGDNCTCTPTVCTCQSETYERCQTLPKSQ
jgi:hypothetical protein